MTDQPKTKSKRILAFDILRGYFILLIASVHLHYYPSLLGLFDGRGQIWTSEAEGFFFISGLLIGIIRRRDIIEGGFKVAAGKLWRRSGRLYLVSIALSILYLAIARNAAFYGIAGAKDGLDQTSEFLQLLVRVITLGYSYGWADFLNYYVAFLFIAPFLLWLLVRRQWPAVLLLIAGGWVLRWSGDWGVFNPYLQWQIFFFMGVVLGFYWPKLEHAFRDLPMRRRRMLKVGAVLSSALIYAGGMIMVFIPQHFEPRAVPGGFWGDLTQLIQAAAANPIYQAMLVDGRLGLLRPLVWLAVFAGMYVVVRRFESRILRFAGWLLVPFGANSLYAYIVQSILLFGVAFVLVPSGFVINSIVEISIIMLVWLAIRQRFLFRIIPR